MDYAHQYHDIGRIHGRTYTHPLDSIKNMLDRLATQWPEAFDNRDFINRSDHSPENAYRFLCEVAQSLEQHPLTTLQPILNTLLIDEKLKDYHDILKAIHYQKIKESAINSITIPTIHDLENFLNNKGICSIETLKARIIEEFEYYQKELNGGETFHKKDFYKDDGSYIKEEEASRKIASYFSLKLRSLNITCSTEPQMHNRKRGDILFSSSMQKGPIMFITEVKGQWHRRLFSAIKNQLIEQYTIEPRTHGHGLYLVLWFGKDFPVAGRHSHTYTSKEKLQQELKERVPNEYRKLIDILILDLSMD